MARKKSLKKYKPPGPDEFRGYKRGQEVYCYRFPDKLLSHGVIHRFHEETSEGPGITFMCSVTGSYRMALMEDIIDNPTKQQKSKINNAVIRKIRTLKTKK